ncbi:NVEALA domain-containing protein [Bacteroides sp.]
MKKNMIKVAFVAAFALVAGYGVYTAKAQANLSDLALDNVEALAFGEGDPNNECRMNIITWYCTRWGPGTGCYCGM